MTLTHRLTFARDGPKVITVTDSKTLPYRFEVGMFVTRACYESDVISCIDKEEPAIKLGDAEWVSTSAIIADIDHPGTRGLLLQQYREASGHARACVSYYYDADDDGDEREDLPCFRGPWGVDANDDGRSVVVGEGESEGAAILDALTRLAASKAAAAEGAAGLVRVLDTPADVRLDRIESMLVTIAERVGRLEDWMMTP